MLEDQVNRDKLRIRELEREVQGFKEEVQVFKNEVVDLKLVVQAQDLKIKELSQKEGQKVVIVNPVKVLENQYIRFIAKTKTLDQPIPGINILRLQPELKGYIIAGSYLIEHAFLCKAKQRAGTCSHAFLEIPGFIMYNQNNQVQIE